MSWIKIKELNEKRAGLLKEARTMVEAGQLSPEQETRFDAINTEERALAKQVEQIETLNKAEKNVIEMIGRDANGFKVETDKELVTRAYRKNLFGRTLTENEERALVSAGGAFVPETLSKEFVRVGQTLRGVIAAGAKLYNTPTAGPFLIPKLNDTSSTGEILATEVTDFGVQDWSESQVTLPVYTYTSKAMYFSMNYMRDAQLDSLESEIATMAADRIYKIFNVHSTTGDNSSKPQGAVNGSAAGKTFASPTAVTYAEILDLIHSLGEHYRANAVLMFNDNTLLALRKIVASDNRPLWGAGNVIEGRPETMAGCRFVVNPNMADIGASAKPILYGDFSQGYAYRTVGSAPALVNLGPTAKLQVGFVGHFDMGGVVTDSTAIKHGVHPAS